MAVFIGKIVVVLHTILNESKSFIQGRIIRADTPHDHIGMTTNVFCYRMDNKICSQCEWILKVRGAKCIVDRQKTIVLLCQSGYHLYVCNLECRIRR